jgi:PKD repeat protein
MIPHVTQNETQTGMTPPPPTGGSTPYTGLRLVGVALGAALLIAVLLATLPGSVGAARSLAYPLPAISITDPGASGTLRVDTPITFGVTVRSGRDLQFAWDFGDHGGGASGNQPTHTYTDYARDNNGDYQVTVTATDPIGQSTQAQATVHVLPAPPHAAFSATAESDDPFTVQFDASISTGEELGYSWDFGDGQSDTSGSTFHRYDQLGTYNVTLVVTDIAGQRDTATQSVKVFLPPPHASFTTQVDSFDSTCIAFDGTGSTGYQLSYSWDFGDGQSDTFSSSPDHCYSTVGSFTVTLTVTDSGGQKDSKAQTVTVSVPPPQAAFTAQVDSFDTCASFDASSSTGRDLRYVWDFGDGDTNTLGFDSFPFECFPSTGTYTVTLTVTDQFGQQSSTSQQVTITG